MLLTLRILKDHPELRDYDNYQFILKFMEHLSEGHPKITDSHRYLLFAFSGGMNCYLNMGENIDNNLVKEIFTDYDARTGPRYIDLVQQNILGFIKQYFQHLTVETKNMVPYYRDRIAEACQIAHTLPPLENLEDGTNETELTLPSFEMLLGSMEPVIPSSAIAATSSIDAVASDDTDRRLTSYHRQICYEIHQLINEQSCNMANSIHFEFIDLVNLQVKDVTLEPWKFEILSGSLKIMIAKLRSAENVNTAIDAVKIIHTYFCKF